jgi:alcohol dehydrogenase (cytochrome c)
LSHPNIRALQSSLLALGLASLFTSCASATTSASGRINSTAPKYVDWPTYGFDYANTRHFELHDIDRHNVATLVPAWQHVIDAPGPMESSPVVVHGIMYVTSAERDGVEALDAATGTLRWQFWPKLGRFFYCCAKVNRGVAVAAGRVFVATLDGRLIALGAANGHQLWAVAIGDPREGFSETAAPIAWNGVVFVGSAGSEFGIRGSYSALRASDGSLLWRWWATYPGWEGSYVERVNGRSLHRDIRRERVDAPRYRDAWRHGGGAIWMTPALDVRSATLYLSTGNPAPDYNGDTRPGDNLYTDSIVALDARSGRMRWFYQEVPHDLWDYDASSPPFLLDVLDRNGRRVLAVAEAGKTGWLYVLDRNSGSELRVSENFVRQRRLFRVEKGLIEPGGTGGALGPSSYDPHRRLAFVVSLERPEVREPLPSRQFEPGTPQLSGVVRRTVNPANYLCAISPDTGRVVWRRYLSGGPGQRFNIGFISGSLSAGDLVFVPEPNGVLFALDASNGDVVWRYDVAQAFAAASPAAPSPATPSPAPSSVAYPPIARLDAPPIAYIAGGREYIALGATVNANGVERNVVFAFALPR